MRINSLNLFSLFGALAILLCSLTAAQTQGTATFEAIGPTKEIAEGSRFELTFSLKNTSAKRFVPPDFNGFRITGGPSELRGSGFVNNKSYSYQSWSYELEAGSPGAYTIGSATVYTGSQTLRTQPLTVRVGKATASKIKSPPPSPDDRLFVSAELDHETVWFGQQLLYQIKLYTQVAISDYDILDLPQFDDFIAQERRRFDTRVQYQKIKGKKYAVRTLHEIALFPQQAGKLSIGPAQVRLGVEQPGGLSALLGGRPIMLQTQAINIQVNPLPEPMPAHFSGVVGSYAWQLNADRDTLSTDDALTISIRIEGNGDARHFANPQLELPPGLEGFDPKIKEQEEYETGEQFVHARTLDYVILPKEPGDYSLNPELVIFNPDSNKYQTLKAALPINMHVTPGQFYGKNNKLPNIENRPAPTNRSVFFNVWEKISTNLNAPILGTVAAGLAMLSLLIFWYRRRRNRKPMSIVVAETPTRPDIKALRQRMKIVSELLRKNDSRQFYHELLKVVQGHIAFYLNVEPGLLTKKDVQEKLAERRVPEVTIKTLLNLWQRCEQTVFAGQTGNPDMRASFQQAETALAQLDKAMR